MTKLSQWFWAFQITLGANTAMAMMAASHGPGRRSAFRPPGVVASHSRTPGARNSAEYFDITARPAASPAASHQPAPWLFGVRARQQRVIVQNRLAGASGIASMAPRHTVMVALYQSAARNAVRGLAPNALAKSPISQVLSPAARAGMRRTPRGVSPQISVPIRIHQAIIGGWSK